MRKNVLTLEILGPVRQIRDAMPAGILAANQFDDGGRARVSWDRPSGVDDVGVVKAYVDSDAFVLENFRNYAFALMDAMPEGAAIRYVKNGHTQWQFEKVPGGDFVSVRRDFSAAESKVVAPRVSSGKWGLGR